MGLVKAGVTIFWIMDILNMPFMQMFDTTYPLNGWFWTLVMLFTGLIGCGVKEECGMRCELNLRELFRDVELTEDMKSEIVGTVIKDEDGKVHGYVTAVDMDNNIAYCDLYDGPLTEKIRDNYKHEVSINV